MLRIELDSSEGKKDVYFHTPLAFWFEEKMNDIILTAKILEYKVFVEDCSRSITFRKDRCYISFSYKNTHFEANLHCNSDGSKIDSWIKVGESKTTEEFKDLVNKILELL